MLLLRSQLPLDAYIRSLSPAAWFRQGVGITVTGSGVSQWDDASGNGRHLLQGTDANRPAYSGGVLTFDGVNDFLKTAPFTLNQPAFILWVGKQLSWTLGDVIYVGNAHDANALYQSPTSPNIRLYSGANSIENPNLPINTLGVVAVLFNGAGSSIRVNNTASTGGNPGTTASGGFTLGANGGGTTQFGHFETREIAIFPFAPSTEIQERLIAGLMARHGVA